MPRLTPVSILRKAVEILKQDGWIQGALHNDEGEVPGLRGGHCALGAIDEAYDLYMEENGGDFSTNYDLFVQASEARTKAKQLLGTVIRGDSDVVTPTTAESAVVSFNDREGTTFSQVAGKFREAVRRVKEGTLQV